MTIHGIIQHDFKQAERVARQLPQSTEKDLAKTDQEAKQEGLSYGQYTALMAAGWKGKVTDYKR